MMAAVLALCVLGALVCIVGVVLHLRVVRRLDSLAREIDRRILPYLMRHAATLRYDVSSSRVPRTPEQVIADACRLADDLHDLERRAEDLALGPTQNLPATGASKVPHPPAP